MSLMKRCVIINQSPTLDDKNAGIVEKNQGDDGINLRKVKRKKKVHSQKVHRMITRSMVKRNDKENDQIAKAGGKKNLKATDTKNKPTSKNPDKKRRAARNINLEKTKDPILKDHNSIPKVHKKTKRLSKVPLDTNVIVKDLITKHVRAKRGVFQPDPYDADDESVDEGNVFFNPAFFDEFDPDYDTAHFEAYENAWTILSDSEDDYRSSD